MAAWQVCGMPVCMTVVLCLPEQHCNSCSQRHVCPARLELARLLLLPRDLLCSRLPAFSGPPPGLPRRTWWRLSSSPPAWRACWPRRRRATASTAGWVGGQGEVQRRNARSTAHLHCLADSSAPPRWPPCHRCVQVFEGWAYWHALGVTRHPQLRDAALGLLRQVGQQGASVGARSGLGLSF